MNTATETKTEGPSVKESPKLSAKASAIVAKEMAKAAYDTESRNAEKLILERHIAELQSELKGLEERQELYRRVVGPHARRLLQTWLSSMQMAENQFIGFMRNQHEDKKVSYLDLSMPGAVWFFNKERIKEELPALAFAVTGTQALREQNRGDPGFYPVVPRIIEIRAELDELGVAAKTN